VENRTVDREATEERLKAGDHERGATVAPPPAPGKENSLGSSRNESEQQSTREGGAENRRAEKGGPTGRERAPEEGE